MTVELLTEHHLEFLSLKRGFTGSSESTLVKMPHCWKSHVAAQVIKLKQPLKYSVCTYRGMFTYKVGYGILFLSSY